MSMARDFVAFIDHHDIHPPIAQVFGFEEGDKAIEALRKFTGVGKIVVKVQ
jgi:NADPH:quinone reductase-like Zn-dependent oxidoreductase